MIKNTRSNIFGELIFEENYLEDSNQNFEYLSGS
jgi:hypothetical protein